MSEIGNKSQVSYWVNGKHICTIDNAPVPDAKGRVFLKLLGPTVRKILEELEEEIPRPSGYFYVDFIDTVITAYPSFSPVMCYFVQETQVHLR